ncbi:ABC transporter permease [Tellurirhabdus rosea]|uniref:ABC transporter permease n=1 Tax=Tellurirhabdus rosea TaxID=2674997 RepID=UPI0022534441|nr:ABC transporter permease [Tellurirhabdus rosea]
MVASYLKIAWRNLRAQPVYLLINLAGLSVSLAVGLLIFLFLRHHLSTDRHHARYDRIFRVNTDLYLPDGSVEYNPEAPLPLADVLRTEFPQVERAAFLMMNRQLTVASNGPSEPIRFLEEKGTALVEPQWFGIMSYTWLKGNPETALREPNTAVMTHSWAKRYFGSANPVGKILTLNNQIRVTVTGLLADPPPTTDTDIGLFISMATLKGLYPDFNPADWYFLNSTNRLYFTLKDASAASELQKALPALAKKHYGADAAIFRFQVQPMREFHFDVARGGGAVRSSLLWSLAVVGFLLTGAACINFVNLTIAQGLRRSKEAGVRKTLGSSRSQLIGQFLLEAALVCGAGFGLALLWVTGGLTFFSNWVGFPLAFPLDGVTLAYLALLLVVVIGLAGGYPAAVLSGISPRSALLGKLPTAAGLGLNVRRTLVVVQFVVCQGLILGAIVVTWQIRYLQSADLGFRKENVVVVPFPAGAQAAVQTFRQELLREAGIVSVSLHHLPPASEQLNGGSFKFDGQPEWEKYPIRERLGDVHYLPTYGLQLLAGRNFVPGDTICEYLINETLLHKLGFRHPHQVLGKRLQYYLSSVPLPIVGVVRDFNQRSLREEIGPCVIGSHASMYRQVGIRIQGRNLPGTLERIRQTWQRIYPDEVFTYDFLDRKVAQFYQTEQVMARLIGVACAIAVLICCLGLYGLISLTVAQRTKEIGIRKVLGASLTSLWLLVAGDFLRMVLVATVLAWPLSRYLLRGWLEGFAYQIRLAWWMFAAAGGLAVLIALLSVSFQSLKAARMNPVKSLRTE